MVVFFCCVIEISASSTIPHNKKIASDDEILRVATDSHLRLVAGIGERFIARPKGLRFFLFCIPASLGVNALHFESSALRNKRNVMQDSQLRVFFLLLAYACLLAIR